MQERSNHCTVILLLKIMNKLKQFQIQGWNSITTYKQAQDLIFFYFYIQMRPDYPHKIFPDFRNHFFLLMETLAMDASRSQTH
jgi:hypothetical protein